jgi:D-3-phosphoglycerate dehydrogenase / 2-oxoglutarate reductase
MFVNHRILVATRSFGSTSKKPWWVLEESGFELVRADMSVPMTEDRLTELLEDVSGAIVGVVPFTEHVMKNSPDLKIISMHGVGVDHINLKAAEQLGIVVSNCPGTNDQAVADLTIGLMIAAARKIPFADRELRDGKWKRYSGNELWSKTLGLVGFGRIGYGVAKRALGFDMRVLVYDPYIVPEKVGLPGINYLPFEEVISQADFVSLHASLTDETRGMIGSEQFAVMKESAYLINTARGGLVKEDDLVSALTSHQIAAAGLDVFIEEPPLGNALLQLDNIVVTPHIGAHTNEAIERMGILASQNVVAFLEKGSRLNQVN